MLVAIGLYLLVRGVGIGVLALMTVHQNMPLFGQLSSWDGQWYLGIAEHGYHGYGAEALDVQGRPYESAPFAFFPALPVLISIVGSLGIGLPVAGVLVTTGAGVVACPAILRLAQHVTPKPRVGILLVVLTAAAPMSIALSMVYTEALSIAVTAWALVGVLEHRWLLAGVCTMMAGLTRPSATVLIVVVLAAALWNVWHRRAGWHPLFAVLLAPIGLFAWWTTVLVATGTTWQEIEWRGWRTRWDWGQEAVEWSVRAFTHNTGLWETAGVAIVLAGIVLTVFLGRQRVPWPLTGYAAGIVVLTIGSSGLPAVKPRFLLVGAMVLLVPVATRLARHRTWVTTVTLGLYVLGGTWLSAYALVVWPYAI